MCRWKRPWNHSSHHCLTRISSISPDPLESQSRYESGRITAYPPINAAARGGHKEAVQILLDHGASAGEAFISAADGGQVHLLKSLLQKGEVDIHATNKDNSTIGMQALE